MSREFIVADDVVGKLAELVAYLRNELKLSEEAASA